jgi:hypothetical protein
VAQKEKETMAKNATKKQSASETVRTPSGEVLRLTVSSETVERVERDEFPALRAHLAKMAEATNA